MIAPDGIPLATDVRAEEYHRLLGWPRGHVPVGRARELAGWAQNWYQANGRPWVHLREVAAQVTSEALILDGVRFNSPRLRAHFLETGVQRALLVAVSAGRECEEHARQLWQEGKPDEYFFLEVFGSALVEHLVATTNGHLCAAAEREGLMAVPHYSPGYTGWDVAEQGMLFELITRGHTLPGPLEVLPSGMLRPKKSLLAVVGLAPQPASGGVNAPRVPCIGCSLEGCQYRRAPYRHAAPATNAAPAATYATNARALRKWAAERVQLATQADGSIEAVFRFDGTTCSHRPLAFDYRVRLSGPAQGHVILAGQCTPAAEDEGHQSTCSYLRDGAEHLAEIAADRPLLGCPLGDVLRWSCTPVSTGCHCDAESRAHKWRLALEAIHFALAQSPALSRL